MASERLMHTRIHYTILLMLVFSFAAAGFLFARSFQTLAVFFCIAGIFCCWLFFRIYRVSNDAVSYFFNALQNDDTSLLFPEKVENKSLARLYDSMNQLNRHYQNIRLQSEFNERYYKTLIQHSATGLLVLNGQGKIELINQMACRYAGISPDSTNPTLLEVKNPQFYHAICQLQPGENHTYKQVIGNSIQMLSFRATLLRKNDLTLKLISIQDIRQELENREVESYRKLISVLTHEIMNLISPLTSVAASLNNLYHRGSRPAKMSEINEETLKTTLSSIDVIQEQSDGLLNFMSNYRKLSRIPQPEIRTFEVGDWMEQLRVVYSVRMQEMGIDFEIDADKGIDQIEADKALINQVVINLVNNAVDAVAENKGVKMIRMHIGCTSLNRIRLIVSNNGPVIPAEVLDKIFVPFFTTKKEGSGIGLSISQEIMKMHKGSLMVVSGPEDLTSFIAEL